MGNIIQEHIKNTEYLLKNPCLKMIIWEGTRNCNYKCIHCCIPKGDWKKELELTTDEAKRIFSEIAQDFNPAEVFIGITGGEATLRPDLVEIVGFLTKLGFRSGVDSNGFNYSRDLTLIDRLIKAGMTFPTISIDGLREGYKKMRGADNFDSIIKVLNYLTQHYPHKYPSTFTAISKYNLHELPELFDLLESIGIYTARVSAVVPVGKAKPGDDYLLSNKEIRQLLEWVAKKVDLYNEKKTGLLVQYADDGWCGWNLEGKVHPVFLCQTGIMAATILYDGKISACPQLPRDLTVQGDLRKQRFKEVWFNEFKLFRNKEWLKKGKCNSCSEWDYCLGGPMHYRDKEGNMQRCIYWDINEA